jgi:hypothetical protein
MKWPSWVVRSKPTTGSALGQGGRLVLAVLGHAGLELVEIDAQHLGVVRRTQPAASRPAIEEPVMRANRKGPPGLAAGPPVSGTRVIDVLGDLAQLSWIDSVSGGFGVFFHRGLPWSRSSL